MQDLILSAAAIIDPAAFNPETLITAQVREMRQFRALDRAKRVIELTINETRKGQANGQDQS